MSEYPGFIDTAAQIVRTGRNKAAADVAEDILRSYDAWRREQIGGTISPEELARLRAIAEKSRGMRYIGLALSPYAPITEGEVLALLDALAQAQRELGVALAERDEVIKERDARDEIDIPKLERERDEAQEGYLRIVDISAASCKKLEAERDALRMALSESREDFRFIANEENASVPTKRTAIGHLQSVAERAATRIDALLARKRT